VIESERGCAWRVTATLDAAGQRPCTPPLSAGAQATDLSDWSTGWRWLVTQNLDPPSPSERSPAKTTAARSDANRWLSRQLTLVLR